MRPDRHVNSNEVDPAEEFGAAYKKEIDFVVSIITQLGKNERGVSFDWGVV